MMNATATASTIWFGVMSPLVAHATKRTRPNASAVCDHMPHRSTILRKERPT